MAPGNTVPHPGGNAGSERSSPRPQSEPASLCLPPGPLRAHLAAEGRRSAIEHLGLERALGWRVSRWSWSRQPLGVEGPLAGRYLVSRVSGKVEN